MLDAPGKVLVDFWAEWCVPCRAIEPVLVEIADEHPEVRFVKCDVDACPEVAQSHNVMNIPTLLAFNGGRLEKRIVGALNKRDCSTSSPTGWLAAKRAAVARHARPPPASVRDRPGRARSRSAAALRLGASTPRTVVRSLIVTVQTLMPTSRFPTSSIE